MKIIKERSREYNGKSYYKFKVNIPSSVIESAGFREGDEIIIEVVRKGEVRLRKII